MAINHLESIVGMPSRVSVGTVVSIVRIVKVIAICDWSHDFGPYVGFVSKHILLYTWNLLLQQNWFIYVFGHK